MRGLLGALVASMALAGLGQVSGESQAWPTWVSTSLYVLPMLLAAAMTAVRARSGGTASRAWYLLAGALLADALANVLYALSTSVALPEITPSIPDIVWLAYYPLAFFFLLLLARRSLLLVVDHAWLDGLVVSFGAFAVGATLLDITALEPLEATFDPSGVVDSVYLLGDLALIVVVFVVLLASRFRPPTSWWLIAAGLLAFSVADAVYFLQAANGTYLDGTALDLLWPLSALLLGIAAYVDIRDDNAPRLTYALNPVVPGIAVIAAGVVLAFHPDGPLEPLAVVAAITSIVLGVTRMWLAMRDTTSLNDQLSKASLDPLTGLPNMRALRGFTPGRIRGTSLVILDVVDFADVNITLGHDAGDRLLVLIAQRLGGRVRDTDALLRLGSDGFAVLLRADESAATRVAEGLVASLEQPFQVEGVPLRITACAGVASASDDAPTIDAVLRNADDALIRAKGDGPGLVRVHSGGASTRSQERLLRRSQIREAFAAGGRDFLVYYQPIVRIEDDSVFAVEALVRWRHEGVVLPPGAFIQDLVQSGSMATLTRHMLVTSLTELRGAGLDVPVTVNVPPELITDELLEQSAAALHSSGSHQEQLILEITEESLMRTPELAARILNELRSQGIRVELDDFGTGWSGLSSLRDLSVDGLKIDFSFVSRMITDTTARAIVHGVSAVAADLGVLVIYEGVEDREVEELLRAEYSGCLQGYAIGRPMPIEDLARWCALRSS